MSSTDGTAVLRDEQLSRQPVELCDVRAVEIAREIQDRAPLDDLRAHGELQAIAVRDNAAA